MTIEFDVRKLLIVNLLLVIKTVDLTRVLNKR